jgi:hypothetical protein
MKRLKPMANTMFFAGALSPFKQEVWLRLTPCERMRRSLRMLRLVPNIKEVHDRKLFPKPEDM